MKRIIIVCVLMGFVIVSSCIGIGIAIYIDYIRIHNPRFISIDLCPSLIIILFAVWLAILIHEVMHIIGYRLMGCNLRLVYIFPFCIVNDGDRKSIAIAVNAVIGVGGIVIPEIEAVSSQDDLDRLRKAMKLSIIIAPVSSTALLVVSMIGIVSLGRLHGTWVAPAFVFLFSSFLVNSFIIIISMICFGGIVGDFVAFFLIKNNDAFFLNQVYNMFSLQNNKNKNSVRRKGFMIDAIVDLINEMSTNRDCVKASALYSVLDIVIYESILCERKNLMDEIHDKTLFLDKKSILEMSRLEVYCRVLCHMLIYEYLFSTSKSAFDLLMVLTAIKPMTKETRYFVKQCECVLNDSCFEIETKDMMLSALDSILSKLGNYYDDEQYMNQITTRKRNGETIVHEYRNNSQL